MFTLCKPLTHQRKKASTGLVWTPLDVVVVGWGLLKVASEPAENLKFGSNLNSFVPRFVPRMLAHFRVLFTHKEKSRNGIRARLKRLGRVVAPPRLQGSTGAMRRVLPG